MMGKGLHEATDATAEPGKIDFFISRAGADRDLALIIARLLRDSGKSTYLQDEDFSHANFMARMREGFTKVDHGARVLVLLSNAYQASQYCMNEAHYPLTDDVDNIKGRLIVLRVEDCAPTGFLKGIAYVDLVPHLSDMTVLARIVRGAVEAGGDRCETDLANLNRHVAQIVHDEIRPNPTFAGREGDLDKIERALWSTGGAGDAALTNTSGSAAVSGLGGVGKSVLIREYAWRHRTRYHGVWWINAATRDRLITDLNALGARLDASFELMARDDAENAALAVLDHIWQGKRSLPFLLVYDNVEKPGDLERLTPRGGAHILISTRWSKWDDYSELALDVFPRDVAIDYLMRRARKKDAAAAGRLADDLGCLPLALDQAGSYCCYTHQTFDGYRAELKTLLEKQPQKGASVGQYPNSVWGTFNLALERVIAGDPARCVWANPKAEELMRVLAFMAPDQFPLDTITSQHGSGIDISNIEMGDAATALQEVSLIRLGEFDDGQPHVSMHRLVQQVIRSRLDEAGERHEVAAQATQMLENAFSLPVHLTEVPIAARLAPHVTAVLESAPRQGHHALVTGSLDSCLGDWHMTRGSLGEALTAYQNALEILELFPDLIKVETAPIIGRIADCLKRKGDSRGARKYYERSLAISDELAFANPNDTTYQNDLAGDLTSVAHLLLEEGDHIGALAHYKKALAIHENQVVSYPDNADYQRNVAGALYNVGRVFSGSDNLVEALTYYEKSLAAFEKLAAEDIDRPQWQIDLSRTLMAIAGLRRRSGDPTGALDNYEKALVIGEKIAALDPDRPEWQDDVSRGLTNIADMRLAAGDHVGALDYYEKALAIREKLAAGDPENFHSPEDVGWVGWSHYKIAGALATAGEIEQALARQNKAIELFGTLAADFTERPDFQVIVARTATWVGLLDAVVSTKRPDDCFSTLRKVVMLENERDSGNVTARIEALQHLVGQAPLREEHRNRMVNALRKLHELDAAEKLDVEEKEWISLVEAALSATQKSRWANFAFFDRLLGRKA